MKKNEQIEINEIVNYEYETLMESINHFGSTLVGRLRTCQAEVRRTYGYTYLVSYKTIIACIDHNGRCYDFLRKVYGYTATSAQHISKFYNDYGYAKRFTWKEV